MVRTGCVASKNVNSRFSSLFASLPRMQHNPIKSLQNFFFTLSLSTVNASLPLDGGNSPCTITVLFVSIHSNNCTTQILSANRFIRCSPVFRCVSIISIPICPECPCVYILIRSVCFHSAWITKRAFLCAQEAHEKVFPVPNKMCVFSRQNYMWANTRRVYEWERDTKDGYIRRIVRRSFVEALFCATYNTGFYFFCFFFSISLVEL